MPAGASAPPVSVVDPAATVRSCMSVTQGEIVATIDSLGLVEAFDRRPSRRLQARIIEH